MLTYWHEIQGNPAACACQPARAGSVQALSRRHPAKPTRVTSPKPSPHGSISKEINGFRAFGLLGAHLRYAPGMRRHAPRRSQNGTRGTQQRKAGPAKQIQITETLPPTKQNQGKRRPSNKHQLKKGYAPRCAPYIYMSPGERFSSYAPRSAPHIYIYIYICGFVISIVFPTLNAVCALVARCNSGHYVGALVGCSRYESPKEFCH